MLKTCSEFLCSMDAGHINSLFMYIDQPQYYQVKGTTLIILLQWNVLLGNLGSCIHVDVTLTCTTLPNIVPDWLPVAGQCALPHYRNCSVWARGTRPRAQGVDLASKLPSGQPIKDWLDWLDVSEPARFKDVPPHNPTDLLPTSRY